MKYLLTLIIVLILQTAFAQTKSKTSKPTSKNTKINDSGSQWTPSSQNVKPTPTPTLTDTTIDVSGAKWAVLEIFQNSAMVWVVFDNGIKISFYELFNADIRMSRTPSAYVMAAFEYMYRNGFTNVSTYESADNGYIRFIFKGK